MQSGMAPLSAESLPPLSTASDGDHSQSLDDGAKLAVQAHGWPPKRCLSVSEFLRHKRDWRPDGQVPLLLDIRSPEEFVEGHVPGARHVHLDGGDGRAVNALYKQLGRDEALELATAFQEYREGTFVKDAT